MNIASLNSDSLPLTPSSQKTENKYKEAAAALFQRLHSLQQASQFSKSQMHSTLITQLNQKENKFFQGQKYKTEQYSRIMKMIGNIEREIDDQKNNEERLKRAVSGWIQAAERELQSSFQKMEKERIKSESRLEQWVDGKLESFVLKNKNAWAKGSLLKPEPYLEEINQCINDHRRFLEKFGKQCEKLKKETAASVKEVIRASQEEMGKSDEEQVRGFLKSVHMEISTKIRCLQEQRSRTEERVLGVLERIVASCLPNTQNLL